MPTFEQCVRELNSEPKNRLVFFLDNAQIWSLSNLIDVLANNCDIEVTKNYVINDGEIWTLNDDGFLEEPVLKRHPAKPFVTLVRDERIGESMAFESKKEFKDFLLRSSDWTEKDFELFMASEPAVYEAELIQPVGSDKGLYVHNQFTGERGFKKLYVYHICDEDGNVTYLDTLEHEASPEEIEEMTTPKNSFPAMETSF